MPGAYARSSAFLRIFLTILWPCVTFLDELVLSKRFTAGWNISPKHALAMNRHILASHFDHLAFLVWAKLIRFRDAVQHDFSRFAGITFIYFSLTSVMGDIVVDMYHGHRISSRLFCLLFC